MTKFCVAKKKILALVRTQNLAGGAPIIILWRTGGVGFATEKSVRERESNEKNYSIIRY